MKLHYRASKGSRFKRGFIGVSVGSFHHNCFGKFLTMNKRDPVLDPLVYISSQRRWLCYSVWQSLPDKPPFEVVPNCNTVRAFRRMLRRNPGIRGSAILLANNVGLEVYG